MSQATPQQKRIRSKRKIRAIISGTASRPRLSLFRSNNFIYAQLIDDVTQTTIAAVSDKSEKKGTKVERAQSAGASIATKAKAKGVSAVVFDRNGFKYAGRVKAFADAARTAGLNF